MQPINTGAWIVGALILAFAGAFVERRRQERQDSIIIDLKRELSELEQRQAGKFDLLGQLSITQLLQQAAGLAKANPNESSEQIAQQLQKEIAELRAGLGRRITPEQRARFAQAAQRIDTSLSVHIQCRPNDTEAMGYYGQLCELFKDNGMITGGGFSDDRRLDSLGLAIVTPDPDNLSDQARKIAQLLDSATIPYSLARGSSLGSTLRVGKKPE